MAKRSPYKNVTIHPAQGGALIGSASDDVPITQESNYLSSSANYTTKLNFRRETDGELRREGWEVFSPRDIPSNVSEWGADFNTFNALDSQYPIRMIHQFPGTNGTPVLLVIAGPSLWRLRTGEDTYARDLVSGRLYATPNGLNSDDEADEYWRNAGEDFYWERIYSFGHHMDEIDAGGTPVDPFKGGAYRWEVVDVQNHVIINNGVDLPVVYKSEYDKAYPLYGLRENGVISVGTIGVFQDRLFCADLTVITEGYDTWFEQAGDPYGYYYETNLYANQTVKVQRYQYRMVYSAEGEPKLFNSGVVSGNSVVMESGGLPGTLTVQPTGEYVFQTDSNFAVGTPASMYQLFSTGAFQGPEAYTLNMVSPVSAVKTVDEDPNSLLISGIYVRRGDSTVDSLYAYDSANPTDLYAIDYGPDNIYGTADDGDEDYFAGWGDYRLINAAEDDIILINPSTGNPLSAGTYTAVLRPYAEQLRSPAAFREFSQDGSRILQMKQLADKFVVYRDSGFFFISRTNSAEVPFAIEPRYTGGRVADFRHTVIDVDGTQHIFMGNSGIYTINRSSTEPKPMSLFEIGPPFWQQVPPDLAEFVYATDNPVTREIFINCPLGLLTNAKGQYIDEKGEIIYDETVYQYAVGVGPYADNPIVPGDQEYWDIDENAPVPEPRIAWGVVSYDYVSQTLSTIDTSFTAASYIRKPKHNRVGPEEAWFIMGVHQANEGDYIYTGTQYREDYKYGGVLCRYGYGPPKVGEREPYRIYNRLGYGYQSRLKSGLIDFGDSFSDKECRSYVLELSSKYGVTPVRVKISTSTSPQGTEIVETMEARDGVELDYVELNNLVDENMIPLYVKAPYIRDEIIVLPEYEYGDSVAVEPDYIQDQELFFQTTAPIVNSNPIKIVGRTFEVSGVDTRSATQTYNQG